MGGLGEGVEVWPRHVTPRGSYFPSSASGCGRSMEKARCGTPRRPGAFWVNTRSGGVRSPRRARGAGLASEARPRWPMAATPRRLSRRLGHLPSGF